VDSGRPPAIKVAGAACFDLARLDSPLLRTYLSGNRYLSGNHSPSSEVVLVRGEPATVVFRASHAAMDGVGAILWARQVFRALRGEHVEPVTDQMNCAQVRAAIADRLGRELPPPVAPIVPGREWRSPMGTVPPGPRGSMWRRRTIDGVHPGATAKIARQVAAHEGAHGLIVIPVDMRQFLPGLRTIARASSMIKIEIQASDDWTDVHARILTAINEHRYLASRTDPADMDVPLEFKSAMRRMIDDKIRKDDHIITERRVLDCASTVSHFGAVDLADFSADGFTATSCYSLGTVEYRVDVNVMECGGRTEVTVAWRDGPGVAERAEALLDRIEEGLSPRAYRAWDGNVTSHPYPEATLTGLFAAQVARTPDAVAVAGPAGELTYAGLAARAAAVTAALTAAGIGRGDRVGLVAGRTPAAIAAIWGVLGAGAGYLPIDAAYPDTRITALLADAAAPACLLEPPASDRAILPPGCRPIALDTLPPPRPARPGPSPASSPATWPASSTPPAPPAPPRASRSSTPAWSTTPAGPPAKPASTPPPRCP
jgi:AMP-binding enzyme